MGLKTTLLSITGMHDSLCVNRILREFEALEGVTAEVDLASGRARVRASDDTEQGVLVHAVSAAGFSATVVSA
ncbi:heavy-metal-associated domain-containing protein [Mycetocola tolaasinivorans]|uniref:Heavy-metal-associated domain-containing protein n=1 Tax=Mycetocola tolaasinivorans TaxID=76635 RepID=A0A3L7A467_9MICO|nr:heavy metal-associated domain-containing protein [Mycetocola tolaasinivorans]RLP74748.1 heavy-metal-associated domain-containing protein [Mycetocola tolaasinivorans]